MQNNKVVSVIIPVFNVEECIENCIESVLRQTYYNIELILVNDGSTDRTREILSRYESDKRCIIIDKPNGGASSARNVGLCHAHGDYIYFVDSDDYIEPTAIEELVSHMRSSLSDFCCYRAIFYNEEQSVLHGADFSCDYIDNSSEILRDALLGYNIKVSPWTKFFSSKFLQKSAICFQEGVINEDYLFTIECAIHAKKVSFLNRPLYNVYERHNSVSRTMDDRCITSFLQIYNLIQQRYPDVYVQYKDFFRASFIKQLLYILVLASFRLKSYHSFYHLHTLASQSGYMQVSSNAERVVLGPKLYSIYLLSKIPRVFFYVIKGGGR